MNKQKKILCLWLAVTILLNIGLTIIQMHIVSEPKKIYNETMDTLTENIQESVSEIMDDNESMGSMSSGINDALQTFSDSIYGIGIIGKKAWNFSIEWYTFIIFYIIGAGIGVVMELLIKLFTEKEDVPIILYCVNVTGTVFTIYGISCVFRVLL